MGRSMCGHLMQAGYSATVFNRTLSKCDPLRDKGATVVASAKAVAQSSDVVFLMVGFPADLESVVWGEEGVFAGSREGSVIVDMTTSRPEMARRIATDAGKIKAVSLDAPVSGGDIGARNGTLSIMVGGEKDAFLKVKPLFECMGQKISHLGGPGAGQNAKMVNQILIASNMIGVCEALLYAHKAGLDVQQTLAAVSDGAAGSWSLSNLAPRMASRDFAPGFLVDHFIKDMEIALDEARRAHLSLPGLALAHQLYVALKAQGHGRQGTQALLLALESLNNTGPV